MENIVLGLLMSQHNIKLKKVFIQKLIENNQLPSQNVSLNQFLHDIKSLFSIGLNNNLNLDKSVSLTTQLEQSNKAYETFSDHYDLIYMSIKYLLDYVNNIKSNEKIKTYNDLVVDLIDLVRLTFQPKQNTNKNYSLIKNELNILFKWSCLISECILETTNNNELRFNLLNFLLILNQNLLHESAFISKENDNNKSQIVNCLYLMQTDSKFCKNYLKLIRLILVKLLNDYLATNSDQSTSILIEKCLFEIINFLILSVIKEQTAIIEENNYTNQENKIDLKEKLKNLKDITEIIRYFVQKSDKLFEISLKFLIEILSTNEKNESNYQNKLMLNEGAIAELFNCFELEKSKLIFQEFFKNPNQANIDDESIKIFLNNLISLLCWPFENNVDQWIITLMLYLALITKKFQLLISLCEENLDTVLRFIQSKNTAKRSLNVLSFFLINYRHSPKLFHRSCPKLVRLLEKYKQEEKKTIYNHLAILSFGCMSNFGGYPNIYKPLLEVMQNDIDLTNYDSFVSKYLIDNNTQNIQFNNNLSQQLDENEVLDTSNIDENSVELMNKKLRKNVTGLINLGNTCYLNCMIQCLYSCKKFLKSILEFQLEKQNDTSFLGQLQILFSIMHFSERKAIKPNNFVKFCTPSWFRLGQQQDSSEFLIFLLDNLQEQLKILANQNPKLMNSYENLITRLFGIQLTTEIICKKCDSKTTRSDINFYLPLSFDDSHHKENVDTEKSKSLQALIDNFFHTELLSSETDNSYSCSKCQSLQNATKKILFTRDDSRNIHPPEYLILTLNRFIYNFSSNANNSSSENLSPVNKKIMDKLDYPNRLTIKTSYNDQIINEYYELNSIVIHSGSSLHYGHYYSYVTNKKLIEEENNSENSIEVNKQNDQNLMKKSYITEWLIANDSTINASSYDGLTSNLNLFKDDTPYVLFYRRVDDFEKDETIEIDNSNIKNKNLINFIEQDNKVYVVEEKNRLINMIKMKKQAKASASSSISNKYSYSKDDDNDDNSNNRGGGSQSENYCSSDSQRDSGPRIVF